MTIESELNELESQVDSLIGLLQKLKLENISLHKKMMSLNKENIILLDKKKKTAESLKKLILQLHDKLL